MPKFNVVLTCTAITIYDSVEVEAEDEASAQAIAQEMADEGELSEDSTNEEYSSQITTIATEA
jgi:hypothetical protein